MMSNLVTETQFVNLVRGNVFMERLFGGLVHIGFVIDGNICQVRRLVIRVGTINKVDTLQQMIRCGAESVRLNFDYVSTEKIKPW